MEMERSMLDEMNVDVAEKLVEQMNPVDIIEIAKLSPQWNNAINAFRIPIKEIYLDCSGIFRKDPMKFGCAQTVIGIKPMRKSFVHFFLYEKTQEQLNNMLKEPGFIEKEFDEETLVCQYDQTNIKVYSRFPMQTYYAILKHMLFLLSGEVLNVNIAYNSPASDEMIFWMLDQKRVRECKNIKFPMNHGSVLMSSALLNRALDLPNLEHLSIKSMFEDGFQRRKPINIPHLDLAWSGWITRRFLMSLNCVTIYMGDPKLTVKDINAYIKLWLEGENKTLRCLQIGFCRRNNWARKGFRVLMDGIEHVKRDPAVKLKKSKRYFKVNRCCHLDMSQGLDITRKDGALATITYSEQSFNFAVWGYP